MNNFEHTEQSLKYNLQSRNEGRCNVSLYPAFQSLLYILQVYIHSKVYCTFYRFIYRFSNDPSLENAQKQGKMPLPLLGLFLNSRDWHDWGWVVHGIFPCAWVFSRGEIWQAITKFLWFFEGRNYFLLFKVHERVAIRHNKSRFHGGLPFTVMYTCHEVE